MKRKLFLSVMLVGVFSLLVCAQQTSNNEPREVTSGSGARGSGKHEELIRSAYKKLIEYNHADQIRKNDLDGNTIDSDLDLKIELSDFHTGPIIEILNKPYVDLITLPTGEIISLVRGIHTINKGPEEVTFEAEWDKGQYASGFDPEWTIGTVFRFEPAKYVDVGTYTSYSVEVVLKEKRRKYRAIAIFHDLNQTRALDRPEFWDSVIVDLSRVWTESRPSYKSKPELKQPPTSPFANEDTAYSSEGSYKSADYGSSPEQVSVEGFSSDTELLMGGTSDADDFWLAHDEKDHASGSHAGTAKFTPTCSQLLNNRQKCQVLVSDFEAYDTGVLTDVFGIWFHKGVKDRKTDAAYGPAGASVTCASAAGVAFSSCLHLFSCEVNMQLGISIVGGNAGATIIGGNLWRDAHAVSNTCNLASAGGSCTTPGFNGTCPPGSTPNGSGLCCFSDSNCGSLTFINKCFMYGGDYDFFSCTCSGCDACGGSPVVIDINGDGVVLTTAAEGVDFDLNGNGTRDRLGWTKADSDDAWLALDRNGNGNIESGAELFGDYTAQPPGPNKNGFLALAEFDRQSNGGNSDGIIDRQDQVFSQLRLWQDANHNGVSESGELHTLDSLHIKALELDFKESKRVDEFGNEFRYRAKIRDSQDGKVARWAWDVFLAH
jgi:hypothetical protein